MPKKLQTIDANTDIEETGPPVVDPDEPTEPEQPQPKPITNSILLTVKKMLGIAEEYHAFDIDVITNINSVFLSLNQLGVGPEIPFNILSEEPTWDDFLGDQKMFIPGVQTYVYLKTRLLFDPPTSSFAVEAMQKQINELEWRFTIQPKEIKMEPVEPSPDIPETDDESEAAPAALYQAPTRMKRSRSRASPKLFDIFK